MNKTELARILFTEGHTKTIVEAENIVDFLLLQIKSAVDEGEKVTLGGFGIFSKRDHNARNARNPRTGEMIVVPAHSRVKFTVAKAFKELVK